MSPDSHPQDLDAPTRPPTLDPPPPCAMPGTSPSAPRTVDKWIGDYEILDEIAQGGMGIVYRARQLSLQRIVALKMLSDSFFQSQDGQYSLKEEAEVAAKLDHPGIVPIFGCGVHRDRHFFTMAYVEGPTLATKLAQGPLTPKDAAQLMKQVADAIAYAHQQGLIHLDIKPANIILDQQQLRPRVTDFGIARRIDQAQRSNSTCVGTPAYMSPEQADRRHKVGPASDIYAMGAVLYSCVTGRPPFAAATAEQIIYQVLHHPPVPPRRLNPDVPPELEAIILQAMAKSVARRYDSATALSLDLEHFLAGKPVKARATSGMDALRMAIRQHVVFASVSGVAAILLMTLMLTVTGLFISERWHSQQLQRDLDDMNHTLATERAIARQALMRRSREHASPNDFEVDRLIDHAISEESRNPQLALKLGMHVLEEHRPVDPKRVLELFLRVLGEKALDAADDRTLISRASAIANEPLTDAEKFRFGIAAPPSADLKRTDKEQ